MPLHHQIPIKTSDLMPENVYEEKKCDLLNK